MFDEPTSTSSDNTGWQDVNTDDSGAVSSNFQDDISNAHSSLGDVSDGIVSDETSSDLTSSDSVSSDTTTTSSTSSDGVVSDETSSDETSSSVPIVPIVPPTDLPPSEIVGDGTEMMKAYFTEVRAHQESMAIVANNISVMSIVGILLMGIIIGLAVMKVVRL